MNLCFGKPLVLFNGIQTRFMKKGDFIVVLEIFVI